MKIVKHKIQMIVIYTEEIQIHGLPKAKMHMMEQMFTSKWKRLWEVNDNIVLTGLI